MHASVKRIAMALALAGWTVQASAQPPEAKPAGEQTKPAPALKGPESKMPPPQRPSGSAYQGRTLTGEPFEKIPRNTTEVFSVAPKKLIPPAPRSTNEQVLTVAPIRPIGERVDNLPDAFRVTTTDLIGAATVYYSTIDDEGKIEKKSVEFLVVDEISEALQGYLESTIRKTYPTVNVDVLVPNSQTAVLSGYVDKAELVDPIQQLVRGFLAARTGSPPDTVQVVNSIRVTGVQQVQLKVIIAEVERTKLRALGFDWEWQSLATTGLIGSLANSLGTATQGQLNGGFAGPPQIPVPNLSTAGANSPFSVTRAGSFVFTGFLKILANHNLGKILAEPILVTTSGQPAFFNVGGEVPVLIPQGFGTISIQYRPFGTNLSFVPTVLGEGRIRLEVRPEVSELSAANSVIFQGNVIPGFSTRIAETTVELENGQTFGIAGLMQSRVRADTTKTPFLGDMPIFGWAFQNKRYEQRDTELLILVTPHLVEALDERPCKLPGRESRVPNTQEFYIGSKFEPPCFDDPYRDHWYKHKNEIKVPPPAPVQPYDNYGRPDWMNFPPGAVPPAGAPGQPAPPPATEKPQGELPPRAEKVDARLPEYETVDMEQLIPPPPAKRPTSPSAKIVSVESEDVGVEEEEGWTTGNKGN